MTLSAQDAWECLEGDKPHTRADVDAHGDLLRYRLDSRPAWDRDPIRQTYNQGLEQAARQASVGNVTYQTTREGDDWVARTPAGIEVFRVPVSQGDA